MGRRTISKEPGAPIETSVATAEVRLKWGHPILTPEGVEIRLPQFAFPKLRRLGLLERDRASGLLRITKLIYELMGSEYSCLMGTLRAVLGADVSEPEAVDCRCGNCKRDRQKLLRNTLPDWKQLVDTKQPGRREF